MQVQRCRFNWDTLTRCTSNQFRSVGWLGGSYLKVMCIFEVHLLFVINKVKQWTWKEINVDEPGWCRVGWAKTAN